MCASSVAPHVRCLRRVGFCRWGAAAPANRLLATAARFYHVFALAATSTYVLQQLIYAYQASPFIIFDASKCSFVAYLQHKLLHCCTIVPVPLRFRDKNYPTSFLESQITFVTKRANFLSFT